MSSSKAPQLVRGIRDLPTSLVSVGGDEFVLDSRDVVGEVDAGDCLRCGLDLGPLVNNELNATAVLEDLSVSIADGDRSTLLYDI